MRMMEPDGVIHYAAVPEIVGTFIISKLDREGQEFIDLDEDDIDLLESDIVKTEYDERSVLVNVTSRMVRL